jgi:hypothetical protein
MSRKRQEYVRQAAFGELLYERSSQAAVRQAYRPDIRFYSWCAESSQLAA